MILHGLIALLAAQLAGELLCELLGLPLPGAVVGMLLLLAVLAVRGRVTPALSTTAQTLLQYLPLILIPVSAGVMAHAALLRQHALLLVGVIVLTTLLSLIVCGRLAQALINRHAGDRSGPGA